MERSACMGEAVLENRASAGFERESVKVLNSSLIYEPIAETYQTPMAHMENGVAAAAAAAANVITSDPQVSIANGGRQARLCDEAVKIPPAGARSPTSLAFPAIGFRGIPLSNERNQPAFGHPSFGKGAMGSRGAMCRILEPSQAQFNKFDVQLSEVCQRRFVMFDHSGSKRRMIFHPAMMNKFSTSLPSGLHKPGACCLDTLLDEAVSCKHTMDKSLFLTYVAQLGASFPYCNSHLLPKNTGIDSQSSASDNCDTPLSNGENVEAKRERNLDCSPALSYYSHENTEDLEALLSSDEDEVSSTGHSPSELTRDNSPTDSHSNSEGHSVCASKKRKWGVEIHIDNDTFSTATSGNKICKGMSCQNIDGVGTSSGCGKDGHATHKSTNFKDLGSGKQDLTALDLFFSDEVGSSSSANNQKLDKKLLSMQQQPDGRSRKEKIKNVLHLLRGIIPGGESMDTAFVLDEAIQYVRTLQFEVQKLQARKFT